MCLGILFFAFLLIKLFAIKKVFSVFVGEKHDWLLNQEFGLSFARCFLILSYPWQETISVQGDNVNICGDNTQN